MVLEFFVAQRPRQKGNSKRLIRVGRARRWMLVPRTDDKVAEDALAARVQAFRPPAPLFGPVRLDVTFCMPVPRSWPLRRREAALAGRELPAVRPDRGNLLKLVEDALEGPFYVDDGQIVAGEVAKVYAEIPGYRIRLGSLPEAQP